MSDATPPIETLTAPPVVEETDFTRLDPRWVGLDRVVTGIVGFVLVVVSVGPTFGAYFASVAPWHWLVILVWITWTLAWIAAAIWLPPAKYRFWSFQLGDRVMEIRSGIVWRKSVSIPLSRIQHVDLERGPLERKFGLCSLLIHTAGTQAAKHTIPGLDHDTVAPLRNRLILAVDRGNDDAIND